MGWGSKLNDLHVELWPWFDPGSRLYYLNLISALVLTFAFIVLTKNQRKNNFSTIKNGSYLDWFKSHLKNYWFHPSAQIDYKIYAINALLKVFLFGPVLGLSLYISMYTIKALYLLSPDFEPIEGTAFMFFLATVFAFVWDDFLRFYHHYLMHKVGWMWQFHKTHHSAEVLTPITLFRTHPLESLQGSLRNALSFGVSGGLFMFLFSGQVELTTLLGVNIFGFLFNSLTGNLRHSQIPISFGWFENILISPKQHQIHHSDQQIHFNKNYGVALSCWDKMFGSYLRSDTESIKSYGVHGVRSDLLSAQLWPWATDLRIGDLGSKLLFQHIKLSAFYQNVLNRKLIIFISTLVFILSPKLTFTKQCFDYLNDRIGSMEISSMDNQSLDPGLSDNQDVGPSISYQEFFVPYRIVTLMAFDLTFDIKTDLPGIFLATLRQPIEFKNKIIPAVFEKPDLESRFQSLKHPFDPELNGLWVSGHLDWVEIFDRDPMLTLIITKMWRKDTSLILDSKVEKIVVLKD